MTLLDAFMADIRRQLDQISGAVLQIVRGMELLCETIPGLYDELYRRGDVHRLQDAARAAYTIRADLGLGEPTFEYLCTIVRTWPRVLSDLAEIENWYAARRNWDRDPCAGIIVCGLIATARGVFSLFYSDDLVLAIEQIAAANGRSRIWEELRQHCRNVRATAYPCCRDAVVYLLTDGTCQQPSA